MTKFYKQPPYITAFRRQTDNNLIQEFIYIGSEHNHDINHPQFGVIKRYFDAWLGGKDPANCIVLHEGGNMNDVQDSMKGAVYRDGERGYLVWLAHQHNINCASPEPESNQEMQYLRKTFDLGKIFHYYFVRMVAQWHRIDPRPNFEEYFDFVPHMPAKYGVEDYELTLGTIERIHRDITGREFDKEDVDFMRRLANPFLDVAVTNQVANACSYYRDKHIVEKIKDHWDVGKHIFAVYGFSHVERQEEQLKQILN